MNLEGLALWAPLISGPVASVTIAGMLRHHHLLPLDEPNHRSLHTKPIPRSGGVGIMTGVVAGWLALWIGGHSVPYLALGLALALSTLSLLDDIRGLSVLWRFGAQLLAAALLVGVMGLSHLLPGGAFGAALLALAVAWMANLYNFMDGSNGLAGGMALFGFGFHGLAALLAGDFGMAAACACVALAALGFLQFNFHPARIFMGDTGSVPLGFLAAAMGLAGWQEGTWPLVFTVLVFSPFIVDASVTLARRALRGEKVWQAHRDHYYQRLIRMGWSHRRLALAEYGLMAVCGGLALLCRHWSPVLQAGMLALVLVGYGGMMKTIDRAWREHAA